MRRWRRVSHAKSRKREESEWEEARELERGGDDLRFEALVAVVKSQS